MTEPPRRKRLQFHLSTAIAMMFVAGALIWANAVPSKDWPWEGHGFGWPWIYIEVQSTHHVITPRGTLPDGPTENFIHWSGLMNDIPVWLGIVIITAVVLELLIRRRAARKRA